MLGINSKVYSIILISLLSLSGLLYILFSAELISHIVLLNWCYVLFAIAVGVSIVFPAIGMAKDLKKAASALIGVGILGALFVIGYFMSTDESYTVGDQVVEGVVSRLSEAGLITFYIMIVLAVGTILYTEISKAFK